MESEKSHNYSVMNELHMHRAPSASMNVCYTKYLPVQLSAATQTERRQNVFSDPLTPPPTVI